MLKRLYFRFATQTVFFRQNFELTGNKVRLVCLGVPGIRCLAMCVVWIIFSEDNSSENMVNIYMIFGMIPVCLFAGI